MTVVAAVRGALQVVGGALLFVFVLGFALGAFVGLMAPWIDPWLQRRRAAREGTWSEGRWNAAVELVGGRKRAPRGPQDRSH